MRLPPAILLGLMALAVSTAAFAQAPDAAKTVKLCRSNQLVGYGLVVGLQGTGDHFQRAPMTLATLKAVLTRSGNGNFDPAIYEGKVASVIVTTAIRSCAYTDGSFSLKLDKSVDLQISAIGDGTSLRGGALLMTSLLGADGKTYAIGQGVLADCPGSRHPNSACIVGGGVVAQ
jgi:flagellar P-ring protein precursor FlgI